ncbi:MAG: nucleotide exchange factor GrpE [Elainellaceae cyanobacterium]
MDDKQDVMATDNPELENTPSVEEEARSAESLEQNIDVESAGSEMSDSDAVAPTWDEAVIEEDEDGEKVASTSPVEAGEPVITGVDPAIVESMQRELNAAKTQLEDRVAQYVRIAADFENFRKRTQKEREGAEQQIKCSTISELLPVVDNFERARSQIKPQTEAEMTIHKSYQSVYKQLVDSMKRLGVSPMRAEGTEFDPNLHEAVMREPTDQYPEGTVVEELMRGYVMGDRVLRHAMVKVAAEPDEPSSATEPADSDSTASSDADE